MNSPLEYNGKPAEFNSGVGLVVCDSTAINPYMEVMVTLCAWCSKDKTEQLNKVGYKVSHGICKRCAEKFKKGHGA